MPNDGGPSSVFLSRRRLTLKLWPRPEKALVEALGKKGD
jgi:hypothetical protein